MSEETTNENTGDDQAPPPEAGEVEAASDNNDKESSGSKRGPSEGPRGAALEVTVDRNVEKAMKILKRKLIKEGLFKELKMRRYYEKPSEKKKRKAKESLKKLRKEEARLKKNPYL